MAARTVHRRLIAALLASLLAAPSALAADSCMIREAMDGDTLACDDGRVLRLAGLRAPKPAAWENGAAFAAESRAGLDRLARGRRLSWDSALPDRHGRLRVAPRRDDGLSLPAEMLRLGLAMVATQADCRDGAAEMLRLEAEARAAGIGLWALRRHQAQPAETVRGGGFRLVEGRVRSVVKRDGVVYLNFGEDWRRDFTLRLSRGAQAAFAEAGRDPFALQGRLVRVRGWVEWRNGPQMEPDHAEAVEVVE